MTDEDGLRCRTMYFATVGCETLMPSLSSSPCTRGAPQSGLARLIFRIRSRTSLGTPGRPVLPLRDFQAQKSRKPLRDQPITVSGFTIMSGFLQPGHSLDRQAQEKRSTGLR